MPASNKQSTPSSQYDDSEHRQQVLSDVQQFLNSGGVITKVQPTMRADLPKKPESNYGNHPL